MNILQLFIRTAVRFQREEHGAVLAETLVVVPFVTLFSVGILEFGNMFWQKEQIETGLRDAARYLARCQTDATFAAACSETAARNIAFFGTASPSDGAALRVPGWGPDAADITITEPVAGVVRVEAAHGYLSSPLFGWLDLDAISIEAFHEERYIGW
jgi:Flp pilus assembly protein TadG